MRKLFLLSLIALLPLGLIPVNASYAAGANKVIYHVNLGNEQATDALRNIQNHLAVDPTAKIVVVTHSAGVDFLLEGAEDKNGNLYSGPVAALAAKGVEFRVCKITLERRKIDPKKVIPEAKLVPSGVVEVTKLQQEGYAYLKP
ncbi:DsrE family protein [Sulfuricaulis sp.]|jgi:intracellular sulfur oxidation DsrE/DsrF family protein|uniref:DsrE family protein n=1 Tax=Sulfuricaulis sp. TaxID=2003553 RepID=UPI00355996B8